MIGPVRRFVLAFALVGCGDEPAEPAKPAPTGKTENKPDAKRDAPDVKAVAEPTAAACGPERATKLEAELAATCGWGERVAPAGLATLPFKAMPQPRVTAPLLIDVSATQTSLSHHIVGDAEIEAAIPDHLQSIAVEAQALGKPPADPTWILAIDVDAPVTRVRAVVSALGRAAPKGKLAFAVAATEQPPKPRSAEKLAALHDKVGAADPSQLATTIAAEIERTLPPCPDYRKAFEHLATVEPKSRCNEMAKGISAATVTCKCPEGEDDLYTLLYAIAVGTTVPTRELVQLDVTIDPKAALLAPEAKTWGELVASMTDASLAAFWAG